MVKFYIEFAYQIMTHLQTKKINHIGGRGHLSVKYVQL